MKKELLACPVCGAKMFENGNNLFCSNFHCQVGHLPVPKQYIKLISDLIQALKISVSALQSWQGAHDDDFGLALQEIDKILHQKVE